MHNLMNIAVLGCSGAIGSAVTQALASQFPQATIHGFCRSTATAPLVNGALPNVSYHTIDYTNELSISAAAATAAESGLLDLVFVANGLLHDVSNGNDLLPEKSLRDLSMDKFQQIFAANTITPALLAKHFLPQLSRQKPAFFAALSARVGSISDNRLGGWYAYRASKAALNMVIKNAAIEVGRRNKQAIVVGLHPGTVNSELSRPFQGNVPKGKLFTPDYAAQQLLQVLYGLTPADSGHCFAWDGQLIAP